MNNLHKQEGGAGGSGVRGDSDGGRGGGVSERLRVLIHHSTGGGVGGDCRGRVGLVSQVVKQPEDIGEEELSLMDVSEDELSMDEISLGEMSPDPEVALDNAPSGTSLGEGSVGEMSPMRPDEIEGSIGEMSPMRPDEIELEEVGEEVVNEEEDEEKEVVRPDKMEREEGGKEEDEEGAEEIELEKVDMGQVEGVLTSWLRRRAEMEAEEVVREAPVKEMMVWPCGLLIGSRYVSWKVLDGGKVVEPVAFCDGGKILVVAEPPEVGDVEAVAGGLARVLGPVWGMVADVDVGDYCMEGAVVEALEVVEAARLGTVFEPSGVEVELATGGLGRVAPVSGMVEDMLEVVVTVGDVVDELVAGVSLEVTVELICNMWRGECSASSDGWVSG